MASRAGPGEKAFRKALQQSNLANLVDSQAFSFTDGFFIYTSGQIGNYFVNADAVQRGASNYRRAVASMAWLGEHVFRERPVDKYEVISGGETRDWIFSGPVACHLNRPHAMIYKDGRIIGAEVAGKKVAHFADLNNEGSSVRDYWAPFLGKAGATLKDVFFYVDRMEDGVGVMGELGLNSHAVVPLDADAWQYLLDRGVVSREIYTSLMRRMENKDAWAEGKLKDSMGIEFLASEIRKGGRSADRAKKVVREGYPHLTAELVGRLSERGIILDERPH